jgi:Holliday junction resolvase RusA-like endonuclease
MRLVTQFEVVGRCKPWTVGRVSYRKDPDLQAWQDHVAKAARVAMGSAPPVLGPVSVHITFYRQAGYGSKSGDLWAGSVVVSGGKLVKRGLPQPDLANLFKGMEDALQGIVYGNDTQVCEHHAYKYYGMRDYVCVKVCEVNDQESEQSPLSTG